MIIVQPNIYLIVSVFAVLISNKKYIISINFRFLFLSLKLLEDFLFINLA